MRMKDVMPHYNSEIMINYCDLHNKLDYSKKDQGKEKSNK